MGFQCEKILRESWSSSQFLARGKNRSRSLIDGVTKREDPGHVESPLAIRCILQARERRSWNAFARAIRRSSTRNAVATWKNRSIPLRCDATIILAPPGTYVYIPLLIIISNKSSLIILFLINNKSSDDCLTIISFQRFLPARLFDTLTLSDTQTYLSLLFDTHTRLSLLFDTQTHLSLLFDTQIYLLLLFDTQIYPLYFKLLKNPEFRIFIDIFAETEVAFAEIDFRFKKWKRDELSVSMIHADKLDFVFEEYYWNVVRWRAGSWSECSVTCGVGTRTRKLECVQELNARLTMRVAAGACMQPPDLSTVETCSRPACPNVGPELRHMPSQHDVPRWDVGAWSPVSH